MHRGYFAIWRKYQDHPFWREKRVFSKAEAWIDILWEAQHNEVPQQVLIGMRVFTCNYGESLKSVRTWAKRWSWGETKVYRFLKLLKSVGQIETVNETVTTRIIVLNYSQYDPRNIENETQVIGEMKRERNTSETQRETDKNDKNVKNDKKLYNTPSGVLSGSFYDPDCPHQKIIDLYHRILPSLNRIQIWNETSKRNLKTRWREDPERQSLDFWRNLFNYISESDFLMGRKTDWQGDLMWIVLPGNFAKIINGRYNNNKKDLHTRLGEIGEKWLSN